MKALSFLKPLTGVVITAIIAAGTTVFVTNHYFQTKNYSEDEIGKIAANYLIKNPDNLLKAGKALEENNANAFIDRLLHYAPALFDTSVTPNYGPDNADVAVIEFFDYLCHYCQQVSSTVGQVIQQVPNVKYFFKEFPIFASAKPVSGQSAATGLHVYKNFGSKAYLRYHNNLMVTTGTFGRDKRVFTESDLKVVVEKSGFNQAFSDDEKEKYEQVITANMQLGEQLGINGTPGFIVMNKKNPTAATTSFIPGATDINTLKDAINKARGN
ncbi:DsbA family protein [Photorhabdus heterorhabditis]|uniref:DsbA family protein n=1 Tax=Photorhabdus heterorhabditis TaxID=880156 RepID=A0A5B0WHI0_9GAMM|nr:DsbA family protein [Photorhabdus heterorhabditis]KAA1186443.1 DsbA family protein [Photorhabdus heterorhabditis]